MIKGWDPAWGPAPRYATQPNPERKSFGNQIVKVGALLGKNLFPWQRFVARVATEVDPDHGGPYYDQVVVLAPRRAGKSAMIQAVSFHRCSQPGSRTAAWITAQTREAAVRRWRDATEEVVRRVGEPYVKRFHGNSNEKLLWPGNGSFFRPFAPDEFAMHGEDPDLVFVDEFWRFTDQDKKRIQQGYRPAWLVKPGQEWLLTAAGKPQSEWLKQARLAGRAAVEEGRETRTAFFEWCVPEEVGGVPVLELADDRLIRLVVENHPRTDIKINHLRSELEGRGRAEFVRDYGGIDEENDSDEGIIAPGVLRLAATGQPIPREVVVSLGVYVDDDRREATVSGAWRDPETGKATVSLITHRPGTRWIVDDVLLIRAANRVGAVTVRNTGAVRDISDALLRAGVGEGELIKVTIPDWTAACNRFVDEVLDKTILHNPHQAFSAAVRAAGWRQGTAGARSYASLTGAPISALGAHTLAVWGADHLPEDTAPRYSWSAF